MVLGKLCFFFTVALADSVFSAGPAMMPESVCTAHPAMVITIIKTSNLMALMVNPPWCSVDSHAFVVLLHAPLALKYRLQRILFRCLSFFFRQITRTD